MWLLGAKGWASAWAVARVTEGVLGDSQPVRWKWVPDLAGLSVCGSGLGGVGITLASSNAYVRYLSGGLEAHRKGRGSRAKAMSRSITPCFSYA
jgi:hypothetical protein